LEAKGYGMRDVDPNGWYGETVGIYKRASAASLMWAAPIA
jgi:hypothetical protein